MVAAARAAREGRLGIAEDVPNRKEILDQASRVPYHFDEKARYVIEKKEEMRKQGIPSSDDWDSFCFLFLEDAHYMIYEGSGKREIKTATEAAKRMFSDLAA